MNRTILAALCGMFLMGSAWGQTPRTGGNPPTNKLNCIPVKVWGKIHYPATTTICADDIHWVTERAWRTLSDTMAALSKLVLQQQELQASLKALEARPEKKMPTANIIPAIPNGSVCPYGYSYERICADLDGKGNFKFSEKICTLESEGQWCVKDRPISKSAR